MTHGRKSGRDVVAIAPTYGYFAMLPFLLPWSRRAKVEWLLDHYVTIRASHPRARISFVGHSNGTYVLAGAVDSCPAVTFGNVVFAGSVVRSDFDWRRLRGPQVGAVLNYVATTDWVVAIFPRLLGVLRLQDLGGAGHDGFDESPGVTDVEYVPGRHGAALDERHWNDIAAFVLDGKLPATTATATSRSLWVVAAGHAAGFVWLAILAIVVAPIYCLLTLLGLPEVTGWEAYRHWQQSVSATVPPWILAGLLMGWSRLVTTIVTRL